jgi:hypothetical protein
MAEFREVSEVEAALEALAQREIQPIVIRLAREPGRRDSRYAHLLSGPISVPAETSPDMARPAEPPALRSSERLAALEAEVAALRSELERLRGLIEPAR